MRSDDLVFIGAQSSSVQKGKSVCTSFFGIGKKCYIFVDRTLKCSVEKNRNYLVKHDTATLENEYKLKLSCFIGNNGNNQHGQGSQPK